MNSEQKKQFAKIVVKAWTDEDFKKRLKNDPKTVISEEIADIKKDVEVVLHENKPNQINFVLPSKPEIIGLLPEQIEALASQVIEVQLEMFDYF